MRTRNRTVVTAVIAAFLFVGVAAATGLIAGPGVTYEADSGLTVTVAEPHEPGLGNPTPDSTTVDLEDVTVTSTGAGVVTIDQQLGTTTDISAIDLEGETVTVDPVDKSPIDLEGGIDAVTYNAPALDATTTATVTASSEGTVTFHNLPETDQIVAATPGGTILETGDYDGDGALEVVVPEGTTEIQLLEPDPAIDSVTPVDGAELDTRDVELTATVGSPNFPTDSVTVEFVVDGEVMATETTEENTTVSTTASFDGGGQYEYFVRVTDAFGVERTTTTRTVGLPATLFVREETDPEEPVDGEELTVEFFPEDNDTVVERTTEGEEIDLTGLPLGETFAVETTGGADTDYVARRVLIDDITRQQSVYLLDESTPHARASFELADQTGNFPAEDTRLYVEKPLERDGEREFRTVSADTFSPGGMLITRLEEDTRYRLRIENQQGDTRVLGDWRMGDSDTVEVLPIGETSLAGDVDPGVYVDVSTRPPATDADHDTEIVVEYLDTATDVDTDTLEATVTVDGEELHNITEAGPISEYREVIPVDADNWDPDTQAAEVTVEVDRDGETATFERTLGELPDVFADVPMSSETLELLGWIALLAILGLLAVVSPVLAAIVGAGFAGLLSIVGVAPIPMVAVGVAGGIGIMYSFGGN